MRDLSNSKSDQFGFSIVRTRRNIGPFVYLNWGLIDSFPSVCLRALFPRMAPGGSSQCLGYNRTRGECEFVSNISLFTYATAYFKPTRAPNRLAEEHTSVTEPCQLN